MENAKVEELKETLLKENQAFKDLAQQHKHYEDRLSELSSLAYPSEEEMLEESDLKRKKLLVKDEMYNMISEYGQTH